MLLDAEPVNLRGLRIRILDDDEIIEPRDVVRSLTNEVVSVSIFKKGEPYDWYFVEAEVPAWIGKTLIEFHEFGIPKEELAYTPYVRTYEVARIHSEDVLVGKLKGELT